MKFGDFSFLTKFIEGFPIVFQYKMKKRQISSKIAKIIFLNFQSCFYTQTKQLWKFRILRKVLLTDFKIYTGILKENSVIRPVLAVNQQKTISARSPSPKQTSFHPWTPQQRFRRRTAKKP